MERSEVCLCLPTDLLHRILSLLPLQTLFRFRCVCRLWRSLPFSLLFVDLCGSASLLHPPPNALHHWFFAFRLLPRLEYESLSVSSVTNSCTTYTCSIAYDREMLGSSGHSLQAETCLEVLDSAENRYEILDIGSPLLAHFNTGVLDIVDSANGLLLLTLRLEASHNHADSSLKIFVYNPISKDLRGLPSTQWASQKLSMIALQSDDGGRNSAYKIYSLGRHYRPGTTNWLYSFEVYDSKQAADGWQPLSHVKANLSGSGDLHPGSETALMGYVNSNASCNHELGFLYWMSSLEFDEEAGRHTELRACNMNSGFFYRLRGLTYKTSFVNMWPHASGLQLACGVALESDLSITCAVEIWKLHQGEEDAQSDENYYGAKRLPEGTEWQCIDKMPQVLWDQLTGSGNHRIACATSAPLVFVIAEDEEEKMVIYNADQKMWKLVPCLAILHQLFNNKVEPHYHEAFPWDMSFLPNTVFPWIISFRPNPCSVA